MDNLTHTLTGICLSRAGFNRLTPLATPVLIVAANLPDSDIVSLLGGSESYLHWHRNLTHSFIAAPFLAIALAFAFRYFRPSLRLFPVFVIALSGVVSHLLEDLTNIYGVRLLLPFTGEWFNWDLTPVVDFWIWTAFAVAMAAPLLSRLVGSEIGERRGGNGGRGIAIATLLFVMFYNGGRAFIHSRMLAELNARDYAGAAPRRTAAFPASMNPLRWKGVAETDLDYRTFELNALNTFDPSFGTIIRKSEITPFIIQASKTRPFQILSEFAQYPIIRTVQQSDGGNTVELTDLRFGFTSTALFDKNGILTKSWFQFGRVALR